MAEEGTGFEHDFPATRQTIEITRLAPQLSPKRQRLALELIREMLDTPETETAD